jgi:hypothetical protein
MNPTNNERFEGHADKRNQKYKQFPMKFNYFSRQGEVTPGGG